MKKYFYAYKMQMNGLIKIVMKHYLYDEGA